MRTALTTFSIFLYILVANRTLAATPLVTGNGFGFAVVSPQTGELTKFYAHPYRFEKPDPKDDLAEGIETTNFIQSARWQKNPDASQSSALNDSVALDFEQDSHVIVSTSLSPSSSTAVSAAAVRSPAKQFFFMPFGLEQNALITYIEADEKSSTTTCFAPTWSSAVKTTTLLKIQGQKIRALRFRELKETLLVVPLSDDGGAASRKDTCYTGTGFAFLPVENRKDSAQVVKAFREWQKNRTPAELKNEELRQIELWRAHPRVDFQNDAEVKLWRQSEIFLRMAQSREPNRAGRNNHGLIVASLPEGMWFVSWVRDMAYATLALIRMGHQEEARWALQAYFDAKPMGKMIQEVRGKPYQISTVRYFGDGSEEPFFTMEGSTNVEYDNWGLVLWVLGEYVERYGDLGFLQTPTYRGSLYDSAKYFIAEPLLGNLDVLKNNHGSIVTLDTSIWEERPEDKKHFAYSTMAAIHGLNHFRALAKAEKDFVFAEKLKTQIIQLEKGFKHSYVVGNRLRGTVEESFKNDIDGAVLQGINWGVVTDAKLIQGTLDSMEQLHMPSGGYRRVRGDTQYEKQEFLWVNFSLAEILLRQGQFKKADALLSVMVEKSSHDHNFIPEMYVSEVNEEFPGQIGDPTGSIPMVGYGAGVYVSHLLERTKLHETLANH